MIIKKNKAPRIDCLFNYRFKSKIILLYGGYERKINVVWITPRMVNVVSTVVKTAEITK